jgi:hypothetical protein
MQPRPQIRRQNGGGFACTTYDVLTGRFVRFTAGGEAALAGHNVKLACLPAEAELINRRHSRAPAGQGQQRALVEIDSRRAPGKLSAAVPEAIDPKDFDLVVWRARTSVPLAARARASRRGGQGQSAVHVDHEYAAATLPGAHPGRRRKRVP